MNLRFLDELECVLNKYELNKNEICIIGSSVLACYDIRENHDLDFALYPKARARILEKYNGQIEILPSGTINFSENIQSLWGRYKKIGLLDEELFEDTYTTHMAGYRVAKIEVEIAQKMERNFEKDRRDLKRMGDSYCRISGFDNGLFEQLKRKRKAVIFGAGANARLAYHCYCTRYELLCYVDNNEGLWGDELNGLTVCSPDILKDTDAIIIISSSRYTDEIKKDIYEKFGKRKVISFCMKEEFTILGGI